jgi:hypothetical protein
LSIAAECRLLIKLSRSGSRNCLFQIGNWHSAIGNYSSPISTRGFVEFNFEYSRSNSFVSSEITFGNITCTSTN